MKSITPDISLNSASLLEGRLRDTERLATAKTDPSHLSDEEKYNYAKAARGFESLFVSMLFKQMRESLTDEDEKKEEGDLSFGADTLNGLTDMQFGDYVARGGHGIGIAELIYKQMTKGEQLPMISVELPTMKGTKNDAPDSEPIIPDTVHKKSNPKPIIPSSDKDISGMGDNFLERVGKRISQYEPMIMQAARKHNVPDTLIRAVITAESAGRHDAVSPVGAKGLMQLMDGTAAGLGVKNSLDPAQNIEGGTKYLRQMLDEFDGDISLALAAYNAGPGAVKKHGGIPPYKETRAYVRKITRYLGDQG